MACSNHGPTGFLDRCCIGVMVGFQEFLVVLVADILSNIDPVYNVSKICWYIG
jgi:hypothetical protein